MTYTIKNLTEVQDMAPRFGFDEVQEARFPREDLNSETIGLAFHRVKPSRRQAFAHRHEQAEEIYVVVSGSGRMKLDDDVIDIDTMDAVRVAPTVARAFEAGPDGLELLVFGPRHQGDGEVLREDFCASYWSTSAGAATGPVPPPPARSPWRAGRRSVASPRSRRHRRRLVADQLAGRTADLQPVALEHGQRPLGDRDLAERGRVHVVGHHLVAAAEVAQVEDAARPRSPARCRDRRVQLARPSRPARGRPRSSGAVTVSTRSQRSARNASARRKRRLERAARPSRRRGRR